MWLLAICPLCSFFFFLIDWLIDWLLCWVFVSVLEFSLVAASGGHSSSRCVGLSLSWPLLLWSTGSRRASSVVVAHRPSCSAACGIFPDQGSNPCPLHWQADSQPLHHQGSPVLSSFSKYTCVTAAPSDIEPSLHIHYIFMPSNLNYFYDAESRKEGVPHSLEHLAVS